MTGLARGVCKPNFSASTSPAKWRTRDTRTSAVCICNTPHRRRHPSFSLFDFSSPFVSSSLSFSFSLLDRFSGKDTIASTSCISRWMSSEMFLKLECAIKGSQGRQALHRIKREYSRAAKGPPCMIVMLDIFSRPRSSWILK